MLKINDLYRRMLYDDQHSGYNLLWLPSLRVRLHVHVHVSPWTGQFLDPNLILRSNQTMKIEDSYRGMLHDDEHSE